MTTMEQINAIWKQRTGKDLTPDEAWKMVEFIQDATKNADRRIDEAQNGEQA